MNASGIASTGGDAVLIVPPFAGIDRPSLGLHLLQACAAAEGLKVNIVYGNIAFAKVIGVDLYEAICFAPTADLLGERIFSPIAFGTHAEYRLTERTLRKVGLNAPLKRFGVRLEDLHQAAATFVEFFVASLVRGKACVFGCTTTFEQTAASVAILQSIKRAAPWATTLIGGANCDGEMASGVADLTTDIDYVFSGESERTFPQVLKAVLAGEALSGRIVTGDPCRDMDALPTPKFTEYYDQLASIPDLGRFDPAESIWLPYEASRGCWWGEKNHCTFCGINGTGMTFRQKSPDKVIAELSTLLPSHPNKKVLFVDNIMPVSYFDTVLSRFEQINDGLHMFYEQKANLTLEKVERLSRAGVKVIQPGIESLSTTLLKRMRKGVSASQNLALLRYALAFDVAVNWNLLHDFPGDHEENYREILDLIPHIMHLHPPTGVCQLSIDRFSPYYDKAEAFGISNVQPMPAYGDVYPNGIDTMRIAYHFIGEYDSASRRDPELPRQLEAVVERWREAWTTTKGRRPLLQIDELDDDTFILLDTRSGTKQQLRFVDHNRALLALSAQRAEAWPAEDLRWALDEAQVALPLDGLLAPLAVARPEVMARFDKKRLSGPCR